MGINDKVRLYRRMAAESDTYIEGRAILNDLHRTYVENGYNLRAIHIDNELVRLTVWFQEDAKKRNVAVKSVKFYERQLKKNWKDIDKQFYLEWEYECERSDLERLDAKLVKRAKRIKDLETELEGLLTPLYDDEDDSALTPEEERYECRKSHYQGLHDACNRRERKLRWMLWGSNYKCTEKRARTAFARIDRLHIREAMTGAWYWKLSMLVIKYAIEQNFVTKQALTNFVLLPKEEKRKARKLKENFWAAAYDRLQNFRKGFKDFQLPTNKYVLNIKHVNYEDKMGNPYSVSEDALIAALDEKYKMDNDFLMRAMERASKMRVARDMRKINRLRNRNQE